MNIKSIYIYWQEGLESKLESLRNWIKCKFPECTIIEKNSLEPKKKSYDPSRYQYDAVYLLEELPDEPITLWVTNVDLYHPGYRYLYGAATKGRAVVSDFRPDTEEGFLKEVSHELGHAFGLSHCKNDCVMNQSVSERKLEQKSYDFCDLCRRKLEKY